MCNKIKKQYALIILKALARMDHARDRLLWFKEPYYTEHRIRQTASSNTRRARLSLSHSFIELLDAAFENSIHIIKLRAHTSNWLQPCDRTLFCPLKNAHNKACNNLMTNFLGSVVSRASFCSMGLSSKHGWKLLMLTTLFVGFEASIRKQFHQKSFSQFHLRDYWYCEQREYIGCCCCWVSNRAWCDGWARWDKSDRISLVIITCNRNCCRSPGTKISGKLW